jgi:hypothetical protein
VKDEGTIIEDEGPQAEVQPPDEGPKECTGEASCADKGICEGLTKSSCVNGEWQCDYDDVAGFEGPAEISCDGIDNDCDGAVDEEMNDVSQSSCKLDGVCTTGVQAVCFAGGWLCDYSQVENYEGEKENSCDNLDNDCDGDKDEFLESAGNVICPNIGVCFGRVITACQEGLWECNFDIALGFGYEEEESSCDNLDNDCDGETDESLATVDAEAPEDRVCSIDGICGLEQGGLICQDGIMVCDPATFTGFEGPDELTCDGLDNDCDGQTDEDLTTFEGVVCQGVGVCNAGGNPACIDGNVTCDYSGLNTEETVVFEAFGETLCDGLDNDCDGATDEEIVSYEEGDLVGCKLDGICGGQPVKTRCQNGLPVCDYTEVVGFESVESSCDGLDNDCDGETDIGLLATNADDLSCLVDGVCTTGLVSTCAEGAWFCDYTFVLHFEETETLCDNLDNDCDGETDNELTSVDNSDCKQVGVCTEGVSANCEAGVWDCEYAGVTDYEAVEATCDGLDNDCDGSVDEEITDVGQSNCKTSGICNTGVQALCTGGGWICDYAEVVGYQGNTESLCDQLDNDCDGDTDEISCALGDTCNEDAQCATDFCKLAFEGGPSFCVNSLDDCLTVLAEGGAEIAVSGTTGCIDEIQVAECLDGLWQETITCADPTPVCISGDCLVCVPNSTGCDGKDVTQCDSEGSALTVTETCPDGQTCFGEGECALDGEQIANLTVFDAQNKASIAIHPDDFFLVIWTSQNASPNNIDTSGKSVVGRWFFNDGTQHPAHPLEFVANTFTAGNQSDPSVAINQNGVAMVAWMSGGQDSSGDGIYARRLTMDDGLVGVEFLVNEVSAGAQSFPQVSAMKDGRFAVVWESDNEDGDARGIILRIFEETGVPATGNIIVNTLTDGFQLAPSVAALADGNIAVAWSTFSSSMNLHYQIFDPTGTKIGTERELNTYTTGNQENVHCGPADVGSFACVWESVGQDGSGAGVYGRVISNDGNPLSDEFLVADTTDGDQTQPYTWKLGNDGFGVMWTSVTGVGGNDTFLRTFGSAGNATGDENMVNSTLGENQDEGACASFSKAHAACVWTSFNQDGWGDGIVYKMVDP